jgi:glycosyltransferase involved in cell wall biosynthesis
VRILLIHNRYQSSSPSGEDVAFDNERALLTAAGHDVQTYIRANDDLRSPFERAVAGAALFWSPRSYDDIASIIRGSRPDIAHFHNTFPQISISGYAACRDAGVPVVQTLHNYRLVCPSGLLLRDARPCEDCVGRLPLPAIRHRCYRGSLTPTALLATMLTINHASGAYYHDVDRYICLTEFARQRFIRGGLPAHKLVIKPNTLAAPPAAGDGSGGYALFVGRLGPEKGVGTLLRAWQDIRDLPLRVAGDGPLRTELEQQARASGAPVQFLGILPRSEIFELMRAATLLVIPSECYEGFPVTALEAMACGTPMVVSALGALDEILAAPAQCLKFPPGDAPALRECVRRLLAQPALLADMRARNRAIFDARYAPVHAARALARIYADVIGQPDLSASVLR